MPQINGNQTPLTPGQWETWASVEIATAVDESRRGSRAHSDLRSAEKALDLDHDPAQALYLLTLAIPRITSDKVAAHVAKALAYLGAASLPVRDTQLESVRENLSHALTDAAGWDT